MKTKSFELPSKGYFYDSENPLSTGTLELRYMTASDEDILSDKQYAKKGETLDKLLHSVITNPEVNLDTMLVGDKAAAVVATRIMAYGPKYTFTFTPPGQMSDSRKVTIDLTEINDKEIEFEKFNKTQKTFKHVLPISGDEIEFKLLRHSDQRDMRFETKKLKHSGGPSPTVTLRLKHQIVSVNGSNQDIGNYVNEMLARDSMSLRRYMDQVSPDIDMVYEYENDTGGIDEVPIGLEPEFFFPSEMNTL